MAATTTTTLQERLRFLAQQVGGPSALAALLGIHRATLHDFTTGEREVPTNRLEKMAAMYPCDLRWLRDGVGDPPEASPARVLEAKECLKSTNVRGLGIGRFRTGAKLDPQVERILVGLTSSVGRGHEVRLEAARERVLELMKRYEEARIQKVLGKATYEDVKAGRTCPSLELLVTLAVKLGVKPMWLLALED